jgi:hypothetical protein
VQTRDLVCSVKTWSRICGAPLSRCTARGMTLVNRSPGVKALHRAQDDGVE